MSNGGLVLGILLLGTGILVGGLSLPLLLGKVRMNGWYGVRIPKSFESEANWYALNRYGAVQMLWYAGVLVVLGGVVIYVPPRVGSVWFFCALAAPALLTIPMLVMLLRYARRLP
jgi:uncharacterized membrane protein